VAPMSMTDTSLSEAGPEETEAATEQPFRPGPAASPDHKTVGRRCLWLAMVFLVVGGASAVVLRTQLARPDTDLVGRRVYEQLTRFHRTFPALIFLLPPSPHPSL